jgi:hypothetical protein
MSPIDPVVRYLLDAGSVGPQDEAYLDWAVGIIRIRASAAEWAAILAAPEARSETQRSLLETATHETLHFTQIVTAGWPYSFAIDLSSIVSEALQGAESLDALASRARQAQVSVDRTLTKLDDRGQTGLTVRDIMEGATVLAQKRMNWANLNAARYVDVLDDEDGGTEYRAAYEAAAAALGDEAFDALPMIAAASLCTRRPQDVFPVLLDELRLRGRRFNLDYNFSLVVEALNRQHRDVLLGTAVEAAEQKPSHLVYTNVVRELNEMAGRGEFKIADFFTRPHELSQEMAVQAVRPMLFNAAPGERFAAHLPDALWRDREADERNELAEALIQLHAMSTLVMGAAEEAPT